MFNRGVIIPTGDEIRNGTVLDTDSPEIMKILTSINPVSEIKRIPPLLDDENKISESIIEHSKTSNLIVLIGGSGGGHRYSKTLSKDFTHSSLESILENKHCNEIYGKNGHMWCKLVIGKLGECLVVNVPGPYDETVAAIKAFKVEYLKDQDNLKGINEAMIEAVKGQYK